jgi:hypothetical protein
MRIPLTTLITLCLGAGVALAGPIERELEARWRGAHVLLNVESRSHCNGTYTNNRINGRLSQGRGARGFGEGELGQVKNLVVKRSRIDVLVDLHHPVLVPRQAGPFTLYDERSCKLELEIEVPRELVREKDIDGIDALLLQAMNRFVSFADAEDSDLWNGRERESYPPDYEETLLAYEAWKIEQHNLGVEQKLVESGEVLAALTHSISSGPFYLEGFAEGVESTRSLKSSGECGTLVSLSLRAPTPKTPDHVEGDEDDRRRWREGFGDGVLLVRALLLQQRLPGCFIPTPHPPARAALDDEP